MMRTFLGFIFACFLFLTGRSCGMNQADRLFTKKLHESAFYDLDFYHQGRRFGVKERQ